MKDAPENVGVSERSAAPLEKEQLKVPSLHVRVQRRKFVHAQVELDTDVAQVLLHECRLQPVEFSVRGLQRQRQSGRRTIAVRIGVAGFVKKRARLRRIVSEHKAVGSVSPREGRQE